MAIRILTDSTSDISPQEAKERDIWLMPMPVTFGDRSYLDNVDIDHPTFYKMLAESEVFPTTAQLPPNDYLAWFEKAKAAGDEVVCIPLASTLSGTYQNAVIAKEMCGYDGIHLVDACMTTTPLYALIDYACAMRERGLSAGEIAAATLSASMRLRMYGFVDTLEYLHKGGRISGAVKVVGSMLRVKPIIDIDRTGISIIGKTMGLKKAFAYITESLAPAIDPDPAVPYVYYGYSGPDDNCRLLMEQIDEAYHPPGVKVRSIGSIVGAHVGPGGIFVIYIEAEKP